MHIPLLLWQITFENDNIFVESGESPNKNKIILEKVIGLHKRWWKEATVYQIYPRSFRDTNGDGIGDIPGIIEKLDYIRGLGVDVIWLCPVYRSPNDDNGYDISDYRSIMPDFGTMADWEKLLEGVHQRGMRLIMDLVVNHTSDEHAWFVESRSSKDNPYRDYYIWRKGEGDRPPNNWTSFFAGSSWQYDEVTGEYYLHLFSRKQPDLNWENPAVRREVYDMMNWWLDKGIDGFRMDVVNLISKVPGLPSVGDPNVLNWGGANFMNGPRIHEFLKEMNREALAGRDVMTVGEMPGVTVEEAQRYTGEAENELNMVFQFELMECESYWGGRNVNWSLPAFKAIVDKWQQGLKEGGWNSNYLNNHDQPRMVSRFGNDGPYWKESAKMLATLVHTLPGTPFVFQGEEIGMTNVHFPSIEDYNDIDTRNHYRELVAAGWRPEDALTYYHDRSRDNARTPMQWDASENAGFTSGRPWLGVNPNYKEINVASQIGDEDSILSYYKRVIRFRKEREAMVYGDFRLLQPEHPTVFAYLRTLGGERYAVLLNFSDKPSSFSDEALSSFGQVALSNVGRTGFDPAALELAPFEAVVVK